MFSFLFRTFFGSGGKSNYNEITPPPSDPRQSSSHSKDSLSISSKEQSSISIDLNVPDEFESKYGTPPMSLKRRLTDYHHCHPQQNRETSQISLCSPPSLSLDGSIHSVTTFDDVEEKADENERNMLFGDISLPNYTPPSINDFLTSSPPMPMMMFPEIDEDFYPNPQQWNRAASLPHPQSRMEGFYHNFEEENNFMNGILPPMPFPDFHDLQTPSENGFIDNMLPLTFSSSSNTRNRHHFHEIPSPEGFPLSPMIPKFTMNQPSLFQEEQELSEDYVIGGYAPLQFGTEVIEYTFVVRKLGFGHFATVWLCYNLESQGYSAVKVSRSDPAYAQTCEEEIKFLRCISDHASSPGANRVSRLMDDFKYISPFGKHCCASQIPLGRSLYQLIVQSGQVGFSLPIIQKLAFHLLEGLKFLHNDCGIIHTDLKPENITINCNRNDLRHLTRLALTDHVLARKTLFAHAHFPANIKDRLEMANSTIYFDGVKKLDSSRQNLLKALWNNEFKNTEGEFEEFAKSLREKAINEIFPEFIEPQRQQQQKHEIRGENDEDDDDDDGDEDDLEALLMGNEISFQIVDLGTAQHKDNITSTQFQTLQYRSPECVLKHHITPAIDIWSLGCVLYEAATGDYLLNPRGNRNDLDRNRASRDHFCCYISVLGSPPSDLRSTFPNNRIFNRLFGPEGKFINEPNFGSTPSLSEHIKRHINEPDVPIFTSFMERMLCYNPERRGTAEDLLKFKWFKNFGSQEENKQ